MAVTVTGNPSATRREPPEDREPAGLAQWCGVPA